MRILGYFGAAFIAIFLGFFFTMGLMVLATIFTNIFNAALAGHDYIDGNSNLFNSTGVI